MVRFFYLIQQKFIYLLIYYNFMKTGTVKFYNSTKGFGFIKDDETNEEYFVHATGVIDDITDEDKVTFDLKEGRKGLNAIDVKKA